MYAIRSYYDQYWLWRDCAISRPPGPGFQLQPVKHAMCPDPQHPAFAKLHLADAFHARTQYGRRVFQLRLDTVVIGAIGRFSYNFV